MIRLILALFVTSSLLAESQYPVDISYMVADIKYSKEHGVKICEVQHGILSTFFGDVYLHGDRGSIVPKIVDVFSEFDLQKWMCSTHVGFDPLRKSLEERPDWSSSFTQQLLFGEKAFQNLGKTAPEDPYSISSYSGMLYMNPSELFDKAAHPGIIVMDAATHPYWADKYKMSLLFRTCDKLLAIKPEWNLYKSEYSPDLAAKIEQDLGGDSFVIKPRGSFLGHGVIIVAKEELDATLRYILTESDTLKHDKDKSYNHWARDRFKSFIVERYYPSDLLQHEDKLYEPSMRVAFICIYNNKTIDFRFLGGYWMLPIKSIDEPGSLNERKKAHCKPPYFVNASQEELAEIERQLSATLPLLYEAMLNEKAK